MYLFGALVASTGAITVATSVHAIVPGDLFSDVLCGLRAFPACRCARRPHPDRTALPGTRTHHARRAPDAGTR